MRDSLRPLESGLELTAAHAGLAVQRESPGATNCALLCDHYGDNVVTLCRQSKPSLHAELAPTKRPPGPQIFVHLSDQH
jgi:hypothetical protein